MISVRPWPVTEEQRAMQCVKEADARGIRGEPNNASGRWVPPNTRIKWARASAERSADIDAGWLLRPRARDRCWRVAVRPSCCL